MINTNLVMYASIGLTLILFLTIPVRRALVMSYCLLWMFLPMAQIDLPGLPPLGKPATIGAGVFVAIVLFYSDLIVKQFKVRWFDFPLVLFAVIAPFVSAFMNGLGMDGALHETINNLFLWVVPYFAGRIILGDELGVQELATGIFLSVLIYCPLAWYEMLMSPQLHKIIYGWHPADFAQARRGWGYRPVLFMQHGLMTAMWLVAGSLCGLWLLRNKRLRWKWNVSPKLAVGFCVFTAAVCNSTGAVLLMGVALLALFATRRTNPAWVLVPIIAIAPLYIAARSTNLVKGESLVNMVAPINEYRAASLGFRLESEDAYVARAWEQPVLGWGGFGRQRPIDETTGKRKISDGLWIIIFGKTGLIGLIAMLVTLLMVPIAVAMNQDVRTWRHPRFAATGVLTVLLCIYTVDNLFNAMVNPIYMLM
ncbi:MAG: hypothetical protein ACPGYV_00330, partial [Phycisphaeraceae bacterium]